MSIIGKKFTTKYFVTIIVSIFLLLYIGYHLVNSFGSSIETTPAVLVDVNETISVDAYIFRDETIITSTKPGEVSARFSDGTMVRNGAVLADVYTSNDSNSIKSKISAIDEQIEILQSASTYETTSFIDSSSVTTELDTLFYGLQTKIIQNNIDYVFRRKNDFLTLINKRQLAQQVVISFSDRIEELQSERKKLVSSLSSITDTVYAPSSGYFSSAVDGYENTFNTSVLETISFNDFSSLIETNPQEYSDNVVGKLATKYIWYIACIMDSNEASSFLATNDYSVIFPYSSDVKIKMNLYRSVVDESTDQTLLIFSTGDIPDGFNFLRKQSVEIVLQNYKGYKVPVSSVHIVDGKKGVYVLNGSVVEFKDITPLAEIDGNLICAEKKVEESASKLGYYDQIITKGKNLYADKIVG